MRERYGLGVVIAGYAIVFGVLGNGIVGLLARDRGVSNLDVVLLLAGIAAVYAGEWLVELATRSAGKEPATAE